MSLMAVLEHSSKVLAVSLIFMPKAYYLSVMFKGNIVQRYLKTKKKHFLQKFHRDFCGRNNCKIAFLASLHCRNLRHHFANKENAKVLFTKRQQSRTNFMAAFFPSLFLNKEAISRKTF